MLPEIIRIGGTKVPGKVSWTSSGLRGGQLEAVLAVELERGVALGEFLLFVSELHDEPLQIQHEELNHAGIHRIAIRSVEVPRRTGSANQIVTLVCGLPDGGVRQLWPFMPSK